jgi:hypothetical protein
MNIVTGLLLAGLGASVVACTANEGSSSTSLTQEPGNCGSLETHVFGIHSTPGGRVKVHIDRPGAHAVVLSAYEATTWTVTAAPGVTIEAIYAVGVHRQTIVGPAGVPAVAESRDQGDPYQCGYGWPSSGPECNTAELINLITHRVHAVTSFHGCYDADAWTLGEDLHVTASCNSDRIEEQADFVQNCDGEDSCGGPVIL